LARWTSSARKLMQRARIDNQIPLPLGGSPAQLRAASRRSGASATGSPIRRSRGPDHDSRSTIAVLHRALRGPAPRHRPPSPIHLDRLTHPRLREHRQQHDPPTRRNPRRQPERSPVHGTAAPQLPVQLPGVRLPPAAAPDPQRDRHRRPPTRTAMSATPTASHGSPGHQLPVGHEWKRDNGSHRPIIRPTRAVDQHRNPRAAQRRCRHAYGAARISRWPARRRDRPGSRDEPESQARPSRAAGQRRSGSRGERRPGRPSSIPPSARIRRTLTSL
jgi:hypothetical protein